MFIPIQLPHLDVPATQIIPFRSAVGHHNTPLLLSVMHVEYCTPLYKKGKVQMALPLLPPIVPTPSNVVIIKIDQQWLHQIKYYIILYLL